MRRWLVLVVLALLGWGVAMFFPSQMSLPDLPELSPADPPGEVVAAARVDGVWLFAGLLHSTDPFDLKAPGWLARADVEGRVTSRIALPPGFHPRALRTHRGFARLVGECAVPGSRGPLGHPLYQACRVVVSPRDEVAVPQSLGPAGADGLTAIVGIGDTDIVGGRIADRSQVVAWNEAGETVWKTDLGELTSLAAAAERGGEVVVVGAIGSSPTTLGRGAAVCLGRQGGVRWRWVAGDVSELRAVVALPDGWSLAGRRQVGERSVPWVVMLSRDGTQTQALDGPGDAPYGTYQALAFDGEALGLLAELFDGTRRVRLDRLHPRTLQWSTRDLMEGRGLVLLVGDGADRWLVAGARFDPEAPHFRAAAGQVDAAGWLWRVQWP